MNEKINSHKARLFLFLPVFFFFSCNKLIEIEPPIDSLTTEQVFETNEQAEWTVAGIYSRMINGEGQLTEVQNKNFAAGLINLAGSLSADDLIGTFGTFHINNYVHTVNQISLRNNLLSANIWKSAYKTIFDCNAALTGLAGSKSPMLKDSVKKQLVAESKVLRAFAYFYLVNCFGDVPLALTIDHNVTRGLPRASIVNVYTQIIKDLQEAYSDLNEDFSVGRGQRIRVNKWAAAALLARVYLYTGNHAEAVRFSTYVIERSDLFLLEPDCNKVFLQNSMETIWQLQQTDMHGDLVVPESKELLPQLEPGTPPHYLNDQLISLFNGSDERLLDWVKQSTNVGYLQHYVVKYKQLQGTSQYLEYHMVLRLAEMYLVRAEARMLLSASNKTAAIDDLNMLRQRADIGLLPYTLTDSEVIDEIAMERRRELFAEWGHRWFDLKRTGKASSVLSQIPYKQPWTGDFQLLYPIPGEERKRNPALTQNPGYDTY